MAAQIRPQKVVLVALSALLVLGATGCKKDKDNAAESGTVSDQGLPFPDATITSAAGPSGAGPWKGTVSVEYRFDYSPNGWSGEGSVSFTDLVATDADSLIYYSAMVVGEGGRRYSDSCNFTGEAWTVNGRDGSEPDTRIAPESKRWSVRRALPGSSSTPGPFSYRRF